MPSMANVPPTFASVLRSILNNRSVAPLLLKKDVLLKLRLEYSLWCTFCECFAPNPFDKRVGDGTDTEGESGDDRSARSGGSGRRNHHHHSYNHNQNNNGIGNYYPHPITETHFRQCESSRHKMQLDTLGFISHDCDVSTVRRLDEISPPVSSGGSSGDTTKRPTKKKVVKWWVRR